MKLGNIQIKKGGGGGGGGVTTFNSRSGAVTLEDTDISGAGGLLADGTVDGATSQAQKFTGGLRTTTIDEATAGGNITIGALPLQANSYVRIDNNNSDTRITVNGTETVNPSIIEIDAAGILVNTNTAYNGTLAQAITDGCNVTNGFITAP